jgi:antitoxin MazE
LYIHQENIMQVAKWGNSLGVRLPMALVHELGISEGDELEVRPVKRKTPKGVPVVEVSKELSKKELIEAIGQKYRGRWPVGWKFDREEANAR